MAPMYFRKGAREGKRYTVDEVFYSYSGGKCHVKHASSAAMMVSTYGRMPPMMIVFLI